MSLLDPYTLAQVSQQEVMWTPTVSQQKLLDVLQHEQKQHIPMRELCRKAGVSRSVWTRAITDLNFVAVVKALEIKVGRQSGRYFNEPIWKPTLFEQKLLNTLQQEEQQEVKLKDLCRKAGVDREVWYRAIKNPNFVVVVETIGVKVGYYGIGHLHVDIASAPEEELHKDVWDIRRLKPDYPKHGRPSDFKVDFTWIENHILRQQVKDYFRLHLSLWKPKTFRSEIESLKLILIFIPTDQHVGTLSRTLVEKTILPQVYQLDDSIKYRGLCCFRAMLSYMTTSPAWIGPRPPRFLIWKEDIPSFKSDALPRPIPFHVLQQLDSLLEQATDAIRDEKQPPILDSIYWDAILILRQTGMRFEDLAHLKAPDKNGRNGCLDQDSGGYWWIRLHHKISKTGKDHRIPTKMSDGVVDAIRRQQERIKDVPNHFGENYLFRANKGMLSYGVFKKMLAKNLSSQLIYENKPYSIATHQFRHTIATDMIEQGIDIYTVKEFLGHASLAMTERYIKVYLSSLKAKYSAYQAKTQTNYATEIIADQVQITQPTNDCDGGWVDGKIGKLYLSPLPDGIGSCAHLAMHDPCPTPPHCPTCPKLRAARRHLPVWENKAKSLLITIEVLRANPKYARAHKKHEQELQHTETVIKTIQQEGFWDGHIHHSSVPQ